jgi:tetratricopeptide (TPR) repeat protein
MLEQTNDEREKADIYHQLGLAKTNQGEYEEAIELYQKGLEIRQRTLPSNHPDLISSYNSLGSVYSNMGEYLKALMYYDKVQEIQQ